MQTLEGYVSESWEAMEALEGWEAMSRLGMSRVGKKLL